jgi:hypothetical protein
MQQSFTKIACAFFFYQNRRDVAFLQTDVKVAYQNEFIIGIFFLWGYLKSRVFKAQAPHTVQELKHRIEQEVKGIPVEMLQRVMGDFRKILSECVERSGGQLNDVIFRK